MFKIAIVITGIMFSRIMLTKVLSNIQNKQKFSQEYFNILNNPKFKVKRSWE